MKNTFDEVLSDLALDAAGIIDRASAAPSTALPTAEAPAKEETTELEDRLSALKAPA